MKALREKISIEWLVIIILILLLFVIIIVSMSITSQQTITGEIVAPPEGIALPTAIPNNNIPLETTLSIEPSEEDIQRDNLRAFFRTILIITIVFFLVIFIVSLIIYLLLRIFNKSKQ
ncbi:MAG: hypothetical protein JEZ06_15365 [Anaerolineaceae bacterium]|nr:hypothetical protein [Anaerolineaceae bacterium]